MKVLTGDSSDCKRSLSSVGEINRVWYELRETGGEYVESWVVLSS